MEKTAAFGPLVFFFVVFGFLLVSFFGLIIKLILKSKNEEWEGEVIDKKKTEIEDDESGMVRDYYYLVVKTTEGKEKKVSLAGAKWESFAIGDSVKKPKGKLLPEKN